MISLARSGIVLFFWLTALAPFGYANPPDEHRQVTIAAIFSHTGIAAAHNAPLVEMVNLAVEEVNASGGVFGQSLALVHLDNQSTPIGSFKAARRAVELGVVAVIGAHWSSHSLAIAPVLKKAGIPMISPGSTHPDVTRVGPCIFRACFLDSLQGEVMAQFAYAQLNARNAVVLRNIDEAYSIELAQFFASAFQEMGGKILFSGDYRGKAVDYSQLIHQILKLPRSPDVLYLPGYTRDSGLFIRQAVGMGVKTIFLGGDAWDEIGNIADDSLEGSFQTAAWHPNVPFKRSQHLINRYKKKFSRAISNASAPLAYDAVMLLTDAIQRAQNLDSEKICQSIAATSKFEGSTGVILFDDNGDPLRKPVIIQKYVNGRFHFHQAIR